MSVPPAAVAPARAADLLAALHADNPVTAAPPFARAVVWSRGDVLRVGDGGWTVLVDGPGRLGRISALWRAAVAGRPDPEAPALAWVSSTFDDASPEPAVLRVPARVLEADAHGVREVPAVMDEAALRAAVGSDPRARLITGGEVPLARDVPAAAWDDAGYAAGVRDVLARMETSGGALEKAVISRTDAVPATEADLWAAVEALRAEYPQTWVFAVGGLLGATPEMLAARRDGVVGSRVLAGSVPRGSDAAEDAALRGRLASDARLRSEHDWAARSVLDALAPVLDLDDDAPAPTVLTLPNVHHLATDVRGRLRSGEGTVLDVVAQLHPTAAVGGTPRAAAVELIREVEPVDRGRYAGPVGWLDEAGDGEIALALRCGQLVEAGEAGFTKGDSPGADRPEGEARRAVRLQAGGGIVPGADPEEEVAEVAVKLLPMRRALGRA